MEIESVICLGLLSAVLIGVIWNHRFGIWCWWAGQKAARKIYPGRINADRRASFAKRYASNLATLRYSIRYMRSLD